MENKYINLRLFIGVMAIIVLFLFLIELNWM